MPKKGKLGRHRKYHYKANSVCTLVVEHATVTQECTTVQSLSDEAPMPHLGEAAMACSSETPTPCLDNAPTPHSSSPMPNREVEAESLVVSIPPKEAWAPTLVVMQKWIQVLSILPPGNCYKGFYVKAKGFYVPYA